jgi:predicted DNA-binding ribbon-helix-helix protein
MRSPVAKRLVHRHSVTIAGRKTSVNLEEPFWNGLQQIAKGQGESASDLIYHINGQRKQSNLSSAIRVFVLSDYQQRARKRTRPGAS